MKACIKAKAYKFYKVTEGKQMKKRYMLNLSNTRKLLVAIDETNQPKCLLFEIQTIGLERDGPLLKKEVLWKK